MVGAGGGGGGGGGGEQGFQVRKRAKHCAQEGAEKQDTKGEKREVNQLQGGGISSGIMNIFNKKRLDKHWPQFLRLAQFLNQTRGAKGYISSHPTTN